MKIGFDRMQSGFEIENLDIVLASRAQNEMLQIQLGSDLFRALRIANRIIIKTSHIIGFASVNLIFPILDKKHYVEESFLLNPNEFKIL